LDQPRDVTIFSDLFEVANGKVRRSGKDTENSSGQRTPRADFALATKFG
jgi:hypothetical protein